VFAEKKNEQISLSAHFLMLKSVVTRTAIICRRLFRTAQAAFPKIQI
jgi:hypothetical protein